MSLKGMLEKTEPQFRNKNRQGGSKKSSKDYKKIRNKWLRQIPKDETPNRKLRKGWEY